MFHKLCICMFHNIGNEKLTKSFSIVVRKYLQNKFKHYTLSSRKTTDTSSTSKKRNIIFGRLFSFGKKLCSYMVLKEYPQIIVHCFLVDSRDVEEISSKRKSLPFSKIEEMNHYSFSGNCIVLLMNNMEIVCSVERKKYQI